MRTAVWKMPVEGRRMVQRLTIDASVSFARSALTTSWSPRFGSLLALAEACLGVLRNVRG